MLTTAKTLLFDHSQHKLKVWGNTAPLDVLAFHGEEHLSQPFSYQIAFTSSDHGLQPAQMLMQDATFTLNAPQVTLPLLGFPLPDPAPLRTLHGVICGFKRLGRSRDESQYQVTLVPRLALLAHSHQQAIYQYLSVPEIVEKILRERHGFQGQDFLFTLAHTYPKREQVMQFEEDDLRFISRLLAEVGIWFRFTADPRLKIDVVEFYDDQRHYQFGVTLPLRNPSGLDAQGTECVWGLQTAHQVVEAGVTTRDYHYPDAAAALNGAVDVTRGDSTTYGDAYHYADNYQILGDQYALEPEPESGMFYARLRHERYLNQQTQLNGFTTSASLAPGQELKVLGLDAPQVFQKGALITGIRSSAARDKSYQVEFTALPYSETVCYRPVPPAKPVMAGTLPARITSTLLNDTYSHIDDQGRYRVSFNFDRAEWKTGYESLWLRLARPYAGDVYGLHLPLIEGVEVAVAFEGGDGDRPYIAHALHDSKHPDLVTLQNYKRNVLRTPSGNKFRLEDERGREHIKLSTEFGGKSQLSLGHLVDSTRQPRGEGFEVRTDLHGAIRAAKGLLITADPQPKAQGDVLEMKQPISLLKGAVNQMVAWGSISQAHHNLSPDASGLQQLLTDANQLTGPTLLMSAPQGISAVSPAAVLLQSGKGLYLQSQAEINLASAQRISANATQAISLLAQQEGMRLVSGKGPLEIESHSDVLSLTSLKDVTVQSVQGSLQLTAKNGITLGCGGAYIRLSPQGEIEIHGPGLLSLKGQHKMESPASEDFPLPELPSSVCKECLKKAQALAQGFVPRER